MVEKFDVHLIRILMVGEEFESISYIYSITSESEVTLGDQRILIYCKNVVHNNPFGSESILSDAVYDDKTYTANSAQKHSL